MRTAFVPPVDRSCTGKRRCGSRAEAKKAAKGRKNQRGVFAYPCDHCEFFHVGHRPKGIFDTERVM